MRYEIVRARDVTQLKERVNDYIGAHSGANLHGGPVLLGDQRDILSDLWGQAVSYDEPLTHEQLKAGVRVV